jgi:hypothetical protein
MGTTRLPVFGSPGSSQSTSVWVTSIDPHPLAGKRRARGRNMTTSDGRSPA